VSAVVVDQATEPVEVQRQSAMDMLVSALYPVVAQLLRADMAAAAWQVVVAHAQQADAAFWADLGRTSGPVTASLRVVEASAGVAS